MHISYEHNESKLAKIVGSFKVLMQNKNVFYYI